MTRILYALLSNGFPQGGHKVTIRHVETLRELGFDARCYIPRSLKNPTWLDHRAVMEVQTPVLPDDIIVIPDDDPVGMQDCINKRRRTVVFVQNPFSFAASRSFQLIDHFPAGDFLTFFSVSAGVQDMLQRAFPTVRKEIIPCFADDRLFAPAQAKLPAIAYSPRKRPLEARAIHNLFASFMDIMTSSGPRS